MKAIIPVAGAGTHLRPHTYTQPKALIPVAGKPIVDYIIDQLLEVEINEFIFIIGYLGEKIEGHIKEKYPNIEAHFVKQQIRLGLGHAIWMAKAAMGDTDELLIMLGDTIVEADLKELVEAPYSLLAVKKVNDPRDFGVAEFDNEGFIKAVVEKPQIPKSNYALIGIYKVKEALGLFDALHHIISNDIRTRDEFHLTDALEHMIKGGVKFKGFAASNWYDCGKREILLETNAILLKKSGFASDNLPMYENTIIINPVNIATGTKIANSIIGPNVTIGENSNINYSIVRDSIIGNFATLQDVSLHSSVIGSDVSITGLSQSLNIGDNTEIDLSGQS